MQQRLVAPTLMPPLPPLSPSPRGTATSTLGPSPASRPAARRLDIIERLVKCPQVCASARTRDGSTALHYAAAFGQTHVLPVLVAAGCAVDSRDSALNTPLHLAAGGPGASLPWPGRQPGLVWSTLL